MGLTFRKSLRVGRLFRLNVSGSGVGASVGVRGARVGVTGKGRGYVDAGGGGLRYRASLGGRQKHEAVETAGLRFKHALWIALALCLLFLAFSR